MLEPLVQTRTHQAKHEVSSDSLVGMVTSPRAGRPRNLGSLPGRGKGITTSPKRPGRLLFNVYRKLRGWCVKLTSHRT
jgi:hypothetical protein